MAHGWENSGEGSLSNTATAGYKPAVFFIPSQENLFAGGNVKRVDAMPQIEAQQELLGSTNIGQDR
jgi:hypothetical protein